MEPNIGQQGAFLARSFGALTQKMRSKGSFISAQLYDGGVLVSPMLALFC